MSPYRPTVGPLFAFLEALDARGPERALAVVVLPEFVPAKRWQYLLHNQSALLLKAALLHRRTKTGGDRVIIDVPFHLHR